MIKDFLASCANGNTIDPEFAGVVVCAVQQDIGYWNAIEYLELIAHVMSPDEMQKSRRICYRARRSETGSDRCPGLLQSLVAFAQ